MDGYKLLHNQTIKSFEKNNRDIKSGHTTRSWKNLLKQVPGKSDRFFYTVIMNDYDNIIGFAYFIIEYNEDETFNFLRLDIIDDTYIGRMEKLSGKKTFWDLLYDLYKEVGLDGVVDVLML